MFSGTACEDFGPVALLDIGLVMRSVGVRSCVQSFAITSCARTIIPRLGGGEGSGMRDLTQRRRDLGRKRTMGKRAQAGTIVAAQLGRAPNNNRKAGLSIDVAVNR